jgi:hypothetical protein
MQITKKKIAAVVATTAVLAMGASGAYAYWTQSTNGQDAGTAATDAGIATLTVTGSDHTGLAPGRDAQAISATVTNPTVANGGPGFNVYVGQVEVSIASVTKNNAPVVGCDASDYTLSNTIMTNAATDLAVGATSTSFTGATIQFNNKPASGGPGNNQNACKNATVNLTFVAS